MEGALKEELVFVTILRLNLEEMTVQLMVQLIWRLRLATKMNAQLMVDGEIGVNGTNVP